MSTTLKTLTDIFNMRRNECLYDAVPDISFFEEGESYFFLRKESVVHLNDITVDRFSPWSGKTIEGKRVTSKLNVYPVDYDGNSYVSNTKGCLLMKCITNVHPRDCQFRRKIVYILDDHKKLETDVFYCYTAQIPLTAPSYANRRILPSHSELVKETLKFRTTNAARQCLKSIGFQDLNNKITSVSRDVNSHVKSNIGRKSVTNFYKILDRYLKKENSEEIMLRPLVETKDNGKVIMRVCVLYKEALKCFGTGLPTVFEFREHIGNVALLDAQSEREKKEYVDSYLKLCNRSGGLGHLDSTLMIDTTFDLSNEYVTIVCGVASTFTNKKSKKNASIILGIMLHSEKTSDNHEAFASFLNENLSEFCPGKTIPSIITDGEDSLKNYNSGTFLKDSIHVRCDVHRWGNIKEMSRKNSVDTEKLQLMLFGRKIQTPHGTCLRKGIFGALTLEEFDEMFIGLVQFLEDAPQMKEWFVRNKSDLFATHSMRKKLEAGWLTQYHSTNILESRNASIKQLITSKKPGQLLLDDFLYLHRNEIQERRNAITGEPSVLSVDSCVSKQVFGSMDARAKRNFLNGFGLDFDDDSAFAFFCAHINVSEEMTEHSKAFDVHRSNKDNNVYFLFNRETLETVMLTIDENYTIYCKATFCRKSKLKNKICCHRLAVIMHLSVEAQELVVKQLKRVNENRGCSQLLTEQYRPGMGSKYTRKGTIHSGQNHSRAFRHLLNSTDEAIQMALEDLRDQEEEEHAYHQELDENNNDDFFA